MALFEDQEGPIQRLEWGLFTIDGVPHGVADGLTVGAGKDIRIVDGQVTPWAERHGHVLKQRMVTGFDPSQTDVLIIGTGVYGRIQCPDRLIVRLKEAGLREILLEPTPMACATFNRLYRAGSRAVLLAHGTC